YLHRIHQELKGIFSNAPFKVSSTEDHCVPGRLELPSYCCNVNTDCCTSANLGDNRNCIQTSVANN
ncbi:hypothetical protein CEXT_161421, partial [Caerostris extrusa]